MNVRIKIHRIKGLPGLPPDKFQNIASNIKLLYNLILLIHQSCKSRFRQMNDLDIIKQLEKEINKKLQKISLDKITDYPRKNGYTMDDNHQIIGLNLDNLKLANIPNNLIILKKLQKLSIYNNNVRKLPDSFNQLQNLSYLSLGSNQLSNLPVSFGQLQSLSKLFLEKNHLKELPTSFGQLQNLNILYLHENQLRELPTSFKQLRNLSKLFLEKNQLKELPTSIGQLQNLNYLNLEGNQLKELPVSFGQLQKLDQLYIRGNPLETPPLEILQKGIGAILRYFKQLEQEGLDKIYEAKILILGEGGAGKTSLANKILDASYKLKPEEKSTQGIDILKYQFPIDDKQFTAHIWDFGGQEIYHATHQFFLTKRSMYVLVADTRKEDARFEYWLQIVELLAGDSPIIIVKNEKQDRSCEINEPRLRGRFAQLKYIESTNLKTNRNLESILEQLQVELKRLPHVGQTLPKTWVDVRLALESDKRNYISLNEFFDICEQHGFKYREDKLQLSGYLHDLGTCLHFQNDPLLKKTVILKPEWGTDAVYKVLDNQRVRNNHGRFTKDDLSNIWQAAEYDNMHDELLQLMMNFKLCYKLTYCDVYIAPQILPTKQPTFDWDSENNTILRYNYEFMPKGMMTQFIVAMHKDIEDKQQRVWKEGVILQKDETRAEVTEEYEKRQIHIRIQGKNRRELATIVLHEWDKIHDSYYNLKVQKLIPCNCHECYNQQHPYFHTYKALLNLKSKGISASQCDHSGEMVNIQNLLGDVLGQYEKQDDSINVNIMKVGGDMNNANANQGDNVQQQFAQYFDSLTPEQQAKLLAQLNK